MTNDRSPYRAALRRRERPVRDVGREDLDVPVGARWAAARASGSRPCRPPRRSSSRHSRSAACLPPDACRSSSGQHVLAQRPDLRRVPEEVRLGDRHLVEQRLPLGLRRPAPASSPRYDGTSGLGGAHPLGDAEAERVAPRLVEGQAGGVVQQRRRSPRTPRRSAPAGSWLPSPVGPGVTRLAGRPPRRSPAAAAGCRRHRRTSPRPASRRPRWSTRPGRCVDAAAVAHPLEAERPSRPMPVSSTPDSRRAIALATEAKVASMPGT